MTFAKPMLLTLAIAGLLTSAAAAPAGWRHYTNTGLGYTIAYPANWKIDTQYVNGALGPGREIHGVAFTIPESFEPGTNLSHNDTALSVESLPGHNCQPAQFVDPAEDVHTLHADGRTYTVASSGDAGAGNRYDTQVFVVDGTSPCIAVRYFIHYTAVENFDPGSVKAFDRAKLIAAFDAIRATLKLGK
jgi:hypothetical protein